MMPMLLGFDPGGEDGFGWCIADSSSTLPLQVKATGVVDNAHDAVREAHSHLKDGEQAVAAGIDAPMFWVPTGDRNVDRIIRDDVRRLGAPSAGGTVQAVNSLRGAGVVQGVLTGILLRGAMRSLPITESHPKALLWLLRIANPSHHPAAISLHSMSQFSVAESAGSTDHERDAAIAALSAWAMVNQPRGWRNLYLQEQPERYSPLESPLAYWMPELVIPEAETMNQSLEDQHEQEAVLRYSMRQAAKVAGENSY